MATHKEQGDLLRLFSSHFYKTHFQLLSKHLIHYTAKYKGISKWTVIFKVRQSQGPNPRYE